MDKLMELLNGKKSYIVAGLIFILTILIGAFHVAIPIWVWPALAALGLGAIKAAIPSTDVQLTGIAQNLLATPWGKYVPCVLIAAGAAAEAFGVSIPVWVWTGLSALGLGGLRANIEVAKSINPNA